MSIPTDSSPLNDEDVPIHVETFSIAHTSELSTNYTETGLIGTGRTLGILYSYAGRRLERAVGRVAHRAGLGPHATFIKMQELLQISWEEDEKTSTYLSFHPSPAKFLSAVTDIFPRGIIMQILLQVARLYQVSISGSVYPTGTNKP